MTEERRQNITWRDIARFAWHYWRANKWLGLATAVMMMAAVLADVFVPVYTGKMVDAMTGGGGSPWRPFGMFMFFAMLYLVLRSLSLLVWNLFASRNLHAIVNDGMRKVQRFSSDWHANTFAGGTVRKITRGMWAFDVFEDTWMMGLFPAVTVMIGMTVMLALSLPMVGLATAAAVALYCAASIWMSVKVLAPRFRASAEQDTRMGAVLADIITGNPTVKAFGTEKREDALFRAVSDSWWGKSYHAWQTAQGADSVRGFLRIVLMAAMLVTTIRLWQAGAASPGDIALVITTFFIIGGYLRDIGQHIAHLQRSVGDMEDIVAFWLREDEVQDAPGAKPIAVKSKDRPDMIMFDNVSFRYGNADRWIYRGMNVRVAAGEKLALVGPSGSGKSTFVKLLQRLYNVTQGRILIDGQDIALVTQDSLRRAVALVPQDPILFHRSLADNIAYGRPGATMEEIADAARQAFAHDFIEALPHGYDTLVGERGVKLSGGERQRVAIARAILADAPVLILDEATSSLDSISEHYIQMALERLMQGRTTITIAHRLSTIQQADRILVFDRGRIVEEGSHATLMATPSRYRALYEMQALGIARGAAREEAVA